MSTLTCHICNIQFHRTPGAPPQFYCSVECKKAAKKAKTKTWKSRPHGYWLTNRSRESRQTERRRIAEHHGRGYMTAPEQDAFYEMHRGAKRDDRQHDQQRAREELLKRSPWLSGVDQADRYWRRYHMDDEFRTKEVERNALKREEFGPAGWRMPWFIRAAFKGNDWCRRHAEECLGYSLDALRRHLEYYFTVDMTWQMYLEASIVIDHIKPLRLFNLRDEKQFKEAWTLSNLRPMMYRDNIAKGGKYEPTDAIELSHCYC